MSARLIIGIDPGVNGAITVLADGVPSTILDMPTQRRSTGGNELDAFAVAEFISGLMMANLGAHIHAVIEATAMRRGNARGTDTKAAEGAGILKGVLASHGVKWTQVVPQVWKRHHGLLKCDKEASRLLAGAKWPLKAMHFARVKDHDRAEALLMADWGNATECWIVHEKKQKSGPKRRSARTRRTIDHAILTGS